MNDNLLKLHEKILGDTSLSFREKKEMLDEVRKAMPPDQNRWNFRYALLPLALTALSTPVYVLVALCLDRSLVTVPDVLLSLSSMALGAIAAFLTGYRDKGAKAEPQG
ncbi:hypothetical protein [Gallaecimonas xiamenensis]|uniref:Uncharacterized protein n=1 Tax=Gallaecimonas xiamenensis 3-C-1 TaxID=745411 RepID=K2IC74_9GAMM|nr:hypothetical protein [Gallaecimonas xiamenensis]EKE67526.1 hypothetical protein B3C1_18477 [Gallaecimonas xiamenensis 3-C-1]